MARVAVGPLAGVPSHLLYHHVYNGTCKAETIWLVLSYDGMTDGTQPVCLKMLKVPGDVGWWDGFVMVAHFIANMTKQITKHLLQLLLSCRLSYRLSTLFMDMDKMQMWLFY